MKYFVVTLYLYFFAIIPSSFAQYTVNGNAFRENCNCYTLTQNFNNQSGSVWNNNRINLTQSFAFTFDVFLGCSDGGADGIAFVLQPISTSVGSSGGGMGYVGINPAVGVTLDTYQNASPDNDPFYDHIAIQLNGDVNHASANTLTPPTAISATNNDVEDCQTHFLKVVWDAPTTTMTVFFDGVQRVTVTRDFVNTVFSGNAQVFWGFTGATGGLSNLQRFCTSLVPKFILLPTQNRCIGEPITFNDSTVTFGGILKRYWNFGDGSPIDSVNINPTHTYTTAGDYNVSLSILALDSCTAVFNQTVRVGSKPVAFFKHAANSDNYCEGSAVQFTDSSYSTIGTINNWYWDLGNGQTSTVSNPSTIYNTAGDFLVKLLVRSAEGCVSDTFYKTVHIYGKPELDFTFTDSVCLGTATNFFGSVISSSDPVTNWRWIFGDTSTVITNTQNASYTFSTPGIRNVVFMATSNGSAGCMGIKTKSVFVVDKPKAAIKIITGCESKQVQLMDSSYTTDGFTITGWWWDLGNGQFSTQQNPLVTYTTAGPRSIRLVVTNNRNCISDTLTTTINIAAKPLAKFGIGETLCNNSSVSFFDSSTVNNASINGWEWINNNTVFSTQQNAAGLFNAGSNTVGLSVTSNEGCKSDTVFKSFSLKTKPQVTMDFNDACRQSTVIFTAAETVTNIGMVSWHWDFGDGNTFTGNPATHVYNSNNNYTIKLYGISAEGCSSDTIQDVINIYGTNAFAGNDTIAAANQPIQLQASGGLSYEWSPSVGLSATGIANPVATNAIDRSYFLRAFTPEGCESFDTINIKIYKGPEIYVPGAFTPNGDGTNDFLKAIPVGISNVEYFMIYNRYGQLIFRTNDYSKGWDGRINGKDQDTGNYVWMAAAIDFRGNKIFRKGTVLLIR